MAYVESHQELGTHPKTRKAARMLGVSVPAMIGHLHLLWHWALTHAQDGELTGWEMDFVADGAQWEGDPQALIDALVSCRVRKDGHGFIEETEDGRLLLHDWEKYAGKLIDRRNQDAQRKRLARAAQDAGMSVPDYLRWQENMRNSSGGGTAHPSDTEHPSAGCPPDVLSSSEGCPPDGVRRVAKRSEAERSSSVAEKSLDNPAAAAAERGAGENQAPPDGQAAPDPPGDPPGERQAAAAEEDAFGVAAAAAAILDKLPDRKKQPRAFVEGLCRLNPHWGPALEKRAQQESARSPWPFKAKIAYEWLTRAELPPDPPGKRHAVRAAPAPSPPLVKQPAKSPAVTVPPTQPPAGGNGTAPEAPAADPLAPHREKLGGKMSLNGSLSPPAPPGSTSAAPPGETLAQRAERTQREEAAIDAELTRLSGDPLSWQALIDEIERGMPQELLADRTKPLYESTFKSQIRKILRERIRAGEAVPEPVEERRAA